MAFISGVTEGGGLQILPQKVFEGGFIYVMAYAEYLNFTTDNIKRYLGYAMIKKV